MADLGADVIQVEPPRGDPARFQGPFAHNDPSPEAALPFHQLNANKRGITLDLSVADGQASFRRLAASADVVIDSDPASMDESGIGYQALAALRPSLVYTA